jgi:hypothetical protein
MTNNLNTFLQIWLTWLFSKALGICGAGLAAIGITTGNNTPSLMAGIVLTALHLALSWWNTRRALNATPPAPKTLATLPLPTPLIAAGLALALLSLTGCATSGPGTNPAPATAATGPALIEASLPLIRTGAAVATGGVLDFAVKQSSTRVRLANEMYAAANAIYSLSGGTFPTPAQFQSSILAFGGSQADANYAQFSTGIAGLYAAYYPKLMTGDTKTAIDLLNALAGGIEDATQSYVAVPPVAGTVALSLNP